MPRHFDVRGLARYSEPRAFVALKKSGHQVAHIFMFVEIEVYLIVCFPPVCGGLLIGLWPSPDLSSWLREGVGYSNGAGNNQYFELCTIITPQAYSGSRLRKHSNPLSLFFTPPDCPWDGTIYREFFPRCCASRVRTPKRTSHRRGRTHILDVSQIQRKMFRAIQIN